MSDEFSKLRREVIVPGDTKPVVAHSLRDAKPHELLLLDRHGAVMSPRRIAVGWGVFGATMLALVGGLFWLGPIYGVAGLITLGASVLSQRGTRSITTLTSKIDRGRLDEARAELAEYPTSRLPRRHQPFVTTLAGRISLRQGKLEEAIAYYEKAIELFEAAGRLDSNPSYWLTRFELCGALARAGRIDEAADLLPPEGHLPNTEMYAVLRCYYGIQLAFYADDERYLPNEDTLHEQGKIALGSNVLGSPLVLIAWACERYGDPELAEHWLVEAQSRLDRLKLEQYAPEIAAWMDARLETVDRPADFEL